MGSRELRWGGITGGAYLAWLYLSYYLGLHTGGLGWIQVASAIGIFLIVLGVALGLRAAWSATPEMTFREGIAAGARISGIAALIAGLAQVGYFFLIHPGWTEYMVGLTDAYFREQGLSDEAIADYVEGARTTFGFRSTVLQAVLAAVFFGMLATFVTAAILRRRRD